jgi:hypothetical protein
MKQHNCSPIDPLLGEIEAQTETLDCIHVVRGLVFIGIAVDAVDRPVAWNPEVVRGAVGLRR